MKVDFLPAERYNCGSCMDNCDASASDGLSSYSIFYCEVNGEKYWACQYCVENRAGKSLDDVFSLEEYRQWLIEEGT